MNTTHEMLNAIARIAGSDRKAAQLLGVSQPVFSEWRTAKKYPSDERALQIAKVIGIDPAFAIAVIQRDRARSAETRAAWQRIAEAFGRAAAIAAIAIGASVSAPDARASHNQNSGASGPKHTLRNSRARAWLAPILCA